jgi:hypothetical protein
MAEVKMLFFIRLSVSLHLCRRGFQDFLKVRTSSVLMLCGCVSIVYELFFTPRLLRMSK